jgi:DNA-binding XRE family transcriptional regulator
VPRKGYEKFSKLRQERFLRAIAEEGLSKTAAAKVAGVHRDTVRVYENEHPEFVKLREQAEMERIGQVENALFKAAIGGNVVAIQVFLYNRDPEHWRDRRNIQHSGGVSLTVEQARKIVDDFLGGAGKQQR